MAEFLVVVLVALALGAIVAWLVGKYRFDAALAAAREQERVLRNQLGLVQGVIGVYYAPDARADQREAWAAHVRSAAAVNPEVASIMEILGVKTGTK